MARDAIRAKNFLYAAYCADKAATLAALLVKKADRFRSLPSAFCLFVFLLQICPLLASRSSCAAWVGIRGTARSRVRAGGLVDKIVQIGAKRLAARRRVLRAPSRRPPRPMRD